MTKLTYFLLTAIVISLVTLAYFGVFGKNFKTSSLLDFSKPVNLKSTPDDIPRGLIAAPTPYLILPTGRQEYLVSSSPDEITTISKIIMNPLDATKDQDQIITVDANSKSDISTINIEYETDNGKTNIPMGLVSGSNKAGTWNAKWRLSDTNDKTYHLTFILKTGLKETIVNFPVR